MPVKSGHFFSMFLWGNEGMLNLSRYFQSPYTNIKHMLIIFKFFCLTIPAWVVFEAIFIYMNSEYKRTCFLLIRVCDTCAVYFRENCARWAWEGFTGLFVQSWFIFHPCQCAFCKTTKMTCLMQLNSQPISIKISSVEWHDRTWEL